MMNQRDVNWRTNSVTGQLNLPTNQLADWITRGLVNSPKCLI